MRGFVKISKYAGMREDLVQAGGGNSSYKISDDKMAIKASGYQLADITEKDGYSLVNPQIIRDRFLGCKNIDELTEEDSKSILSDAFIEGNRPSIETFLHAITGRYTLHTHSMVVNVLTCRKGGMKILSDLFPEALCVPYATPGVELAKAYFKAYKEQVKLQQDMFDIVFLQNHGLVISAESADEVIEKTERVTKKIEKYLGIDMSIYHEVTNLWNSFGNKIVWTVTDKNIIDFYANNHEWEHAFCPDCVVFLGKKFLNLQDNFLQDDINQFMNDYGMPVIVNYKKQLYILADSVKKALEIQSIMSFSAQVMALNKGYDCNLLSEKEQNYLLNWEDEKYRKQIK